MSDKIETKYVHRATGEAVKSTDSMAVALPTKLADVAAVTFGPDERAGLVAYLTHVQELGLPTTLNGDWAATGNLPEGYGVSVYPIGNHEADASSKDGKRSRVIKQVAIIAVPSVSVLWAAGQLGQDFVSEAVARTIGTVVRNRLAKPGANGVVLPFTVEEFITPTDRADPAVAAWKAVASDVKAALVKRSDAFKSLGDPQILSCLKMRSFAQALFPNVTQALWENLLKGLIASAPKKNVSPDVFQHWLDTRDTATNELEIDDSGEFSF